MSNALEKQLNEEIKKNSNLLKMNSSLMNQNQEYSKALFLLKSHLFLMTNSHELNQSDIISSEEALDVARDIIEQMKVDKTCCQCERWKKLYLKQSQESYRLSQSNNSLIEKIQEKQHQDELDHAEVQRLFQDYMHLYQKSLSYEELQANHQKKKEVRSISKGKTNKNQKSMSSSKKTEQTEIKNRKEDTYRQQISDRINRRMQEIQKQVQELRMESIAKESLIRIYRQKERERILYGDISVDL